MPLLRDGLEHCQGCGFKSRERKLYSVGAGGCKLRRLSLWGWDSFDGTTKPKCSVPDTGAEPVISTSTIVHQN